MKPKNADKPDNNRSIIQSILEFISILILGNAKNLDRTNYLSNNKFISSPILLKIFSSLSLRDIFNLSVTSKSIRKITQQTMQTEVPSDIDQQKLNVFFPQKAGTYALLRQHPELRKTTEDLFFGEIAPKKIKKISQNILTELTIPLYQSNATALSAIVNEIIYYLENFRFSNQELQRFETHITELVRTILARVQSNPDLETTHFKKGLLLSTLASFHQEIKTSAKDYQDFSSRLTISLINLSNQKSLNNVPNKQSDTAENYNSDGYQLALSLATIEKTSQKIINTSTLYSWLQEIPSMKKIIYQFTKSALVLALEPLRANSAITIKPGANAASVKMSALEILKELIFSAKTASTTMIDYLTIFFDNKIFIEGICDHCLSLKNHSILLPKPGMAELICFLAAEDRKIISKNISYSEFVTLSTSLSDREFLVFKNGVLNLSQYPFFNNQLLNRDFFKLLIDDLIKMFNGLDITLKMDYFIAAIEIHIITLHLGNSVTFSQISKENAFGLKHLNTHVLQWAKENLQDVVNLYHSGQVTQKIATKLSRIVLKAAVDYHNTHSLDCFGVLCLDFCKYKSYRENIIEIVDKLSKIATKNFALADQLLQQLQLNKNKERALAAIICEIETCPDILKTSPDEVMSSSTHRLSC